MFYLNVGYQYGILDEVEVDGAIVYPSRTSQVDALKRDYDFPEERLFDPQMYLSDYNLDPENHLQLVKRLCQYDWFGAPVRDHDSGEETRTDYKNEIKEDTDTLWPQRTEPQHRWRDAVEECFEFQRQFGATKYIAPTPLIRDPEDDLNEYFQCLDEVLDADPSDKPTLVSVTLDRDAIFHRDPDNNDLIDSLADTLQTHPSVEGAYISLTSSADPHFRIISSKVAGNFLRLVSLLSDELETVVVNFVECLGLACLGVGADGYGSGYFNKGRAFRVSDYHEEGFGIAYPHFHSGNLCLDFDPERDMQRLHDNRLLHYLEDDWTDASEDLREAFDDDIPIDVLGNWKRSRSNYSQARLHFAQNHKQLGSENWDADKTLRWIQDAESAWKYFEGRFSEEPLDRPDGRHLTPWRKAITDQFNRM